MIWQKTLITTIFACCAAASASVFLQIKGKKEFTEKPVLLFSYCAMAITVVLLALQGIHQGRIPVFGRMEALSIYSLAIFISYTSLAVRKHMKGISAIIHPFIAFLMAFTFQSAGSGSAGQEMNWPPAWLSLHVLTAFLGYGFFTTAAILATVYLIQDSSLKKKKIGTMFEIFPSLENLDLLMRKQIAFAFLTFTVSIISGVVMAHRSTDVAKWMLDPKTAATAATWLVYAVLLHLRTRGDRHGRNIAIATVAGFSLILLTFFGVHLLAECTHDFITGQGN